MARSTYQSPTEQMGSSASTAPGARAFGSAGSLTVNSPSLLERRDAVSRLATENRTERNLYKRAFRNYNRLSRRGDPEASMAAIELWDRAQNANIQMTGIPNAGREFDAAAIQLRDEQQFLADSQGIVTPNETLATTDLPDEPDTVGTGTGIDATRRLSGPSAAQGGPLASRPVWSSRNPQDGGPALSAADAAALEDAAVPQEVDPTYQNPDGSRGLVAPEGVGFGGNLDQAFRRRYPNSSRLIDGLASRPSRAEMDRAGGRPSPPPRPRAPGLLDRERMERAERRARTA